MPKILETHSIATVDHLTSPDDFYDVTPDSPALDIFTDFKRYRPEFISSDTDIAKAKTLMQELDVKWKVVVDHQHNFVGTLNLDDISGQKLLALTSKNRHPEDVSVWEVMNSRDSLKAISIQDLEQATVADVIETLKNEHSQHFLVINPETHRIRGVLAANEIARRIHKDVQVEEDMTFYKMFKILFNK